MTSHVSRTQAPEVPEAQRQLRAVLKAAVKADALAIREQRIATRALQRGGSPDAPAAQATLAKTRIAARARLIVYGHVRGRTWAQIEPNHPDGEVWLGSYYLPLVWKQVADEVERLTGSPIEPPEHLASWVRGRHAWR